MSDNLSIRLTNEEALKRTLKELWGCSDEQLNDIKIISIHRLEAGSMITLYVLGKYRLMFLDSYRLTQEAVTINLSNDKGAQICGERIAEMIGAKLLFKLDV